MHNKQRIIALLIIATILAVGGLYTYVVMNSSDTRNSDAAQIIGGEEVTTYTDFSGKIVSLEKYEGTVRVVNSWASWSPFSKTELEDLNSLAEKYSDQGVHIVAINRNEDPVRAKRFLDTIGELPHLEILLDVDDSFYKRMEGQAMPETLYFDRYGTIVMHARGNQSYETIEANISQALNAK